MITQFVDCTQVCVGLVFLIISKLWPRFVIRFAVLLFLRMRAGKTLRQASNTTSEFVVNSEVVLGRLPCCIWFSCLWVRYMGSGRLHFCLMRYSYQAGLLQIASSILAFFWVCNFFWRIIHCRWHAITCSEICSRYSMASLSGVYLHQWTVYFSDGPD